MLNDVELSTVSTGQTDEALAFVQQARAELFPKLSANGLPADLANFERVYLDGEGCFLVARHQGQIVASIASLPYDHRFAQLDYRGLKTVEVVRLFVLAPFRRSGLAGGLYRELHMRAALAHVDVMYLHTHPFLPGAIEFWQRQGFAVVDIETDPVWQTTHMERRLPPC